MSGKSRLLALITASLLLAVEFLPAQIYPFEKIGLEQGMPGNRINDFLQDSRGFYWLATEGTGLVRYDGYEFKTYSQASQPSRLFISCLTEDDNGNIWAGLENGLLCFNGYVFKEYALPVKNEKIRHISAAGRAIIVAGSKGSIWRFYNEKWEEVPFNGSGGINDIAVVDEVIYVAGQNGLYRIEKGATSQLDTNAAQAISIDGEEMVVAFDHYISAGSSKGESQRRTGYRAVDVFSGSNIRVALSVQGSLLVKKGEHEVNLSAENGLPENDYKGCYVDNAGVIWLYSNKGLIKLESLAWKLYREFSQVFSVYQGDAGVFYSGLASGIAITEDNQTQVLENQSGFPFGLIFSIEEYNGQLWLGTEKGLIRRVDNNYRQVEIPRTGGGDFVFALKRARGRLWVGMGTGLMAFSDGRFENVSLRENLPPATVYGISEGKDGSLWFATFNQGFFRYYKGKWEVLRKLHDVRLDSLNFSCFTAVSANDIWAGSLTEGITHVTEKGVERITASELDFAEIQSMAVGEDGTVWAGSNKGLIEIRKGDKNKVLKLSAATGFLGGACAPGAINIKNNILLLGTTEGTQILDISDYQRQRPPPRLALTDIKMFLGQNESLPKYAKDSLPFTLVPAEIELPHDLNFLSFNMAGLTAYQKDKIRYRYRLKGQTGEWTLAGNRREAIFSNIKPGSYTFEAQVARVGEDWSGDQLSYSFKILRPVYLRWWFIVILCVVVGGLTFLFIYDRVKRVNQRLRLENELMEMERKALRLQMNPHFIFNALDSISSFIFRKEPSQAVKYLNNFAKLMRLTLESSMEHLHPVETEVSVLKNYLELEKLRFQDKLDYSIELDEEIDYDVGIPPMLIQPHVENAILHGIKPKEGRGKVEIRFILEDDLLIVEVEDDGIGRKKAKEMKKRKDHRSMATQINRDRLRLLRKSLSEKVTIAIIDKENDNGEATGTKVVIKLPAEGM